MLCRGKNQNISFKIWFQEIFMAYFLPEVEHWPTLEAEICQTKMTPNDHDRIQMNWKIWKFREIRIVFLKENFVKLRHIRGYANHSLCYSKWQKVIRGYWLLVNWPPSQKRRERKKIQFLFLFYVFTRRTYPKLRCCNLIPHRRPSWLIWSIDFRSYMLGFQLC